MRDVIDVILITVGFLLFFITSIEIFNFHFIYQIPGQLFSWSISYVINSVRLPKENSGGWFYEYQTLISGLIAVLGAVGTIVTMYSHHKSSMNIKLISARVHMRDALSIMCKYAEGCFDYISGLIEIPPEKPEHAMNVFKDNIGYLDKKTARTIDRLTFFYQIYNSRLETFSEENQPSNTTMLDRLYEWVHFQCMLNQIFEYARGEVNQISYIDPKNIPFKDMMTAYRVLRSHRFMGSSARVTILASELEEFIIKRHKS